jgi:site-specific DNA recombinase
MKSAYLYIRVSTDEQKRKGYSLPEQEDRLLKYCEYNDIEVKGIYQEDYSARSFNRPEWKKLIATIKKESSKEDNNILFIKWDRFSRNIECAYEMISILRKHRTTAMAIDQRIDFSVPESTLMFAFYLAMPEAENERRALNTASGIRRAKQMGRYPNKAPLGYINLTALDGKKYIAPQHPEANIMKWAFQQIAKNCYKVEEIRKMAIDKGLKCSDSNFWKLIRNPVYCGLVRLSSESEGVQLIKGIHEPLISESLFAEVQNIINTKKKVTSKTDELKAAFPLKGFLICPTCSGKLRGSFSRGSTKRYPYYHCSGTCKTRFKADLLNDSYNNKLQHLVLSKNITELFDLVLMDKNITSQKIGIVHERRLLLKQLEEQEGVLSKARKLFIADKLKFDDFSELKKEHRLITGTLTKELKTVNVKLSVIDRQFQSSDKPLVNIFNGYTELDVVDKRQIISWIPPTNIDIQTGRISIKLDNPLSKILLLKR